MGFLFLKLMFSSTFWHRQANFFHGIFHGIVFFNVDDQRQYHVVIFKTFMVLDFGKYLLLKKKTP